MSVAMVQPFCDRLDAACIDASGYTVIPAPCDLCTAIARQAVDEHLDPLAIDRCQTRTRRLVWTSLAEIGHGED